MISMNLSTKMYDGFLWNFQLIFFKILSEINSCLEISNKLVIFLKCTFWSKTNRLRLNITNLFSLFLNTEFPEEATFTLSKKGHFKLINNGFCYIKFMKSKNLTRWRCSKYALECKAKAITKKINSIEMVKVYNPHNHGPEFEQEHD